MTERGFFTLCTTCGTRLRVRDESAVGQIFACPKCGSMVMIEPPEEDLDGAEEADSSGDTSRGTHEGLFDISSAGLVVGSLVTVLVSTVGILCWSYLAPQDQPASARQDAVAQVSTPSDEPDSMGGQPLADVVPELNDVDPELGDSIPEPVRVRVPELTDVDSGPLDSVDFPRRNDEVSDAGELTDTGQLAETTSISNQGINPIASAEMPESVSGGPGSTTGGGTALRNIATLLEHGVVESSSIEATTSNLVAHDDPHQPEPGEMVDNAAVAAILSTRTALTPAEATRTTAEGSATADTLARLEAPIRSAKFADVPLIDFTRSIMRITNVPIQIDPAALEQTGISATAPIQVAANASTAMSVLKQGLASVKLFPVVEATGIRITSERLEDGSLEEMSLFVGDLRAEGDEHDLAHLVTTLVEPTSWSGVDGATSAGRGTVTVRGDKLIVRNTRYVRIRVLLMLEKLRLARGLRARAKLPEEYLRLEPRWVSLQPRWQRQIDMDVWEEEPFLDVLHQLELASGLRILVDWRSLAAVGWNQATPSTLFARKRPAGDLLRDLVAADGMTIVPIDPGTVQIVTQQAAKRRLYLEFYTVKQLGPEGLALLETLLDSDAGRFALDPSSDVALVIAHADIHRELASVLQN